VRAGAVPGANLDGPYRHRRAAPFVARGSAWRLFLNTAADSPDDIYPSLDGPPLAENGIVTMESRSMVLYVARDVPPT
jgi:isoamylase